MKKLIAIVGVAMAAFSSQASYLWWTVNGEEGGMSDVISYAKGELELGCDQLTVNVMQYQGTDKKNATVISSATMIDEWYTGSQSVSISDLSGQNYSYYIEIVNATTRELVGYGTTITYESLATNGAIVPDEMSAVPTAQIWHGGNSYKAAPEPTSALLMLLGMAGLALRRKQRKLA